MISLLLQVFVGKIDVPPKEVYRYDNCMAHALDYSPRYPSYYDANIAECNDKVSTVFEDRMERAKPENYHQLSSHQRWKLFLRNSEIRPIAIGLSFILVVLLIPPVTFLGKTYASWITGAKNDI